MKIIDAHVHIFDHVHGYGENGCFFSDGGRGIIDDTGAKETVLPAGCKNCFTAEDYIKLMDSCGISKAVLMQNSFYGFNNEYIKESVKNYPDKFIGSFWINPYIENSIKVLNNIIKNANLKIFKLEMSPDKGILSYYPHYRINNEQTKKIFKEMNKIGGLYVLIDSGDIGNIGYQTKEIKEVIEEFENITFIIEHLGCPDVSVFDDSNKLDIWKQMIQLSGSSNAWLGCTGLSLYLEEFYGKFPKTWELLKRALEVVDADRIVWGTDIPFALTLGDYSSQYAYIMQADFLSGDDKQKILAGNAQKLYKM